MVQFKTKFSDTHFIIARRLLFDPERQWTTLDFPDCHRPTVVRFFNELIEHKTLFRSRARGRSTYAVLTDPEALLAECIRQFARNEEKELTFLSQRNTDDLLRSLTAAGKDFYLGRFSGIKKSLVYSTESSLSLLLPDRKLFFGDPLDEFQMDFRLLKVKFGGNVTLVLPRYKLFLRKYAVIEDGLRLPEDFYTYLYLSSTRHVMAAPQKKFIEKKLGGIDGNFLSWR